MPARTRHKAHEDSEVWFFSRSFGGEVDSTGACCLPNARLERATKAFDSGYGYKERTPTAPCHQGAALPALILSISSAKRCSRVFPPSFGGATVGGAEMPYEAAGTGHTYHKREPMARQSTYLPRCHMDLYAVEPYGRVWAVRGSKGLTDDKGSRTGRQRPPWCPQALHLGSETLLACHRRIAASRLCPHPLHLLRQPLLPCLRDRSLSWRRGPRR